MKIHLYNRQKDLPLRKRSIRKAVSQLFNFLKLTPKEVAFYFVSEKEIQELHLKFFDDPTPTDCITFPLDETFLGEVFISPKAALDYAKKRKSDPYEELLLYIVHGTLHLIGFEDRDKKSRQSMRKKEKSCMRYLKNLKCELSSPVRVLEVQKH